MIRRFGLLSRRHVTIGGLRCIGKEWNRLKEVEQGFSTLDAIRR
jgi:hypothetical protein